jgi:thiol-disulfide isomerase/thioredoxin
MNSNTLLLALLLGGAVFGVAKWKEEQANQRAFERRIASGEDSCAGRKFCAVVYMAPWCPACKQIVPRLQRMSKKAVKGDYGLKVVVGRGRSPEDNEQMAAQFGNFGAVDKDEKVFSDLKVSRYPSFFVLDGEGTVILANQEAYYWIQEKL